MMGETKQMVLLKGIELPNSSLEHDETSEKQPPPVPVMPNPKVTPTPPPATPPPQPTPPPNNKITTPISTANPSTPIPGQPNVNPNNHPPMSTPIPTPSQVQPQLPPKVRRDIIRAKLYYFLDLVGFSKVESSIFSRGTITSMRHSMSKA